MALVDIELSKDDFKDSTIHKIHFSMGADCEFEWKEYCPTAFRLLLEFQNIDFDEYMQTICGEDILTRVISLGKPGMVLVISSDDRFVIKLLRKDELQMMLDILPNYYRHLKTNKASLLSKLYGLHYVRLNGGAKIYFAVMNNVMKSNLQTHKCYDLKGTSGRSNLKAVTDNLRMINKDDDFDFSFYIDPLVRCHLLQQIKYDCEFLEAEGIMDYSFMLSMHIEGQHKGLLNFKRQIGDRSFGSERSSPNGICSSDMMTDTSKGSPDADLSLSNLCSQSESTIEKLGIEMPAVAVQTPKNEGGDENSEEYYDVFLNFAIVDIFQSYSIMKRIEHVYKSFQYRSRSVGAVNPTAYSHRFQGFLKRVFQSTNSTGSHSVKESIGSHSDDDCISISSKQSE